MALLSVVIVTLNRKDDLQDAVDSILRQQDVDLELLVIDNGSSDGTEAYAETMAEQDRRVRYFRFADNMGIPAAVNKGFAEGRGDVFFVFDDDQWLDDMLYLKKALALDRHHPWDLMTTRLINCDGRDELWFTQSPRSAPDGFYMGNFCNGTTFIRKRVIDKIGYMEAGYLRYAQENEYAMRAIINGFNVFYCRNLVVWHKRASNCRRPQQSYYMMRNTMLKNYKYFDGMKLFVLNGWQLFQFSARMLCCKISPQALFSAVRDYVKMKPQVGRILDYSNESMQRFFFVSRKVACRPEDIGTIGFWSYCFYGIDRFLTS